VASRSSEGPWCKRVNGPEALLDRFDMSTAEWLEPVISTGRTRVAQQLQRYAASAPERAESARGNDRKPLVFAGMTAGLLLAALVFTALAASMLAVPVLAGLLSRPASAASIECDKHFVELGLLSSTGGVCSVTSEVGRCGPGTKLDPSGRVCKPETPKAAVAPKETPPVVPPPPPAAPETQDGQAPAPRPEPLTIQFKTAGFNLNAKEESSLRAFATVCVLSGRVSLRPSLDRTQKNLERAFLTRLERFKDIMGVGVQVEPKPLVQDLKPATGSVTVSCLPQ
jgi:hypothetical protein